MSDAGLLSERAPAGVAAQPRVEGRASVAARLRDGRTRLADLYQRGSAKISLPRAPGRPGMEAVLLNTAGGITGGDRLEWEARAEPGAHLVCTTQAAERGYRAQPGTLGRVSTRLTLEAGARLDWLPQETILFEGSALRRELHADLAEDAELMAVEALVFGRTAMGERLEDFRFAEHWRVRRGGRLVYADALRAEGGAALAAEAGLRGFVASAAFLHAAPGAPDRLDLARGLIDSAAAAGDGALTAGASAWDGLLTVRFAARDGAALRAALALFLTGYRDAPLPRVWSL